MLCEVKEVTSFQGHGQLTGVEFKEHILKLNIYRRAGIKKAAETLTCNYNYVNYY